MSAPFEWLQNVRSRQRCWRNFTLNCTSGRRRLSSGKTARDNDDDFSSIISHLPQDAPGLMSSNVRIRLAVVAPASSMCA